MTISFDLADLVQPLVLNVPGFGDFELEVHGDLREWLAAGADRKAWAAGRDLVRDLLVSRAKGSETLATSGGSPWELTDEAAESVAEAVLSGASFALRPRWIELKRTGKDVRARRRKASEAYDMTRRGDETATAQLLRLSNDLADDAQLEASGRVIEALGPNYGHIMDAVARADQIQAAVKAAGALDYLTADTPTARALAAARDTTVGRLARGIEGSAFSAARAAAAGIDSSSLSLAARAAAGLTPSAIAAAQGLKLGAMSAVRNAALGLDVTGLTAAHKAALGIGASSLGGLASGLADLEIMKTYALGSDVARLARANLPAYEAFNETILAQSRVLRAAIGARSAADLGLASTLGAWSETQGAYLSDLHQHMRVTRPMLGLVADLASGGLASHMASFAETIAQTGILRPGYQMTAAAGLAGAVSRGVAAETLWAYDDDADVDAPVFSTAVRTARAADSETVTAETITVLMETVQDLQLLILRERDPVRRVGLLEIASFIAVMIALLISIASYMGDEAGRRAEDRDRAAQANFEAEVRQERAEARSEAMERYRTVRYIGSDGPLRTEPHAKGPVMQTVFTGQMAVAKDMRDGWVLVEVFSYAPEQSVTGWLPARRLRVTDR